MTKTKTKKTQTSKTKTVTTRGKSGKTVAAQVATIPALEIKQVTFDTHPKNKNAIGFSIRVKGGGEIDCVVGFNNPTLLKHMKLFHSKKPIPSSIEDEILEFTGECLICIEDYFGLFEEDISDVYVVWVK